jgi:hypothetical protein
MAVANTRVVNGINTRVLHNKDYVEVAERIRIVHELKKEFEIIESQPTVFADRCIWRVVIKVGGTQYIGNAEAKMDAPKNSPDGTNPFECAETSALGRALAFAGFGTVESIASYDEVMRSKPFVAVIEQPNGRVVDSHQAPRQIATAKSQPTTRTRLNAVYDAGKSKALWDRADGMFPFISALLGINVNKDTIYEMPEELLARLEQAVAEEPDSKAS